MKPRINLSIRLHESTLKDLDLISKIFHGNRSQALRFVLRRGFQSLGPNWRKETWRFEQDIMP